MAVDKSRGKTKEHPEDPHALINDTQQVVVQDQQNSFSSGKNQ